MHPHQHLDNLDFGMVKDGDGDLGWIDATRDGGIPDMPKQSDNPREVIMMEDVSIWLSVDPTAPELLSDQSDVGPVFDEILVSAHDISGDIFLH